MKTWMFAVLAAVLTATALALAGGGSTAAYADEGACGNGAIDVPDSGAVFNFVVACEHHDSCYDPGGTETDRKACDDTFLAEMKASCATMWSSKPLKRLACNSVATTYYLGVRLGGWAFFDYS